MLTVDLLVAARCQRCFVFEFLKFAFHCIPLFDSPVVELLSGA